MASNLVNKMKSNNSGIRDSKTKFDSSVIKHRVVSSVSGGSSIDSKHKFTSSTKSSAEVYFNYLLHTESVNNKFDMLDVDLPCGLVLISHHFFISNAITTRITNNNMEISSASTSALPAPPPQYPPESLTERVLRALEHRLRLLHRANSDFFILGATGNVYTVNISSAPSCSCPDRTTPCKHILFVYIRVLSVSLDDPCLWLQTLNPSQVASLLSAPIALDAVAGVVIRQRFQEMYTHRAVTHPDGKVPPVVAEEGSMCPVCLEDMG
ncbi:mitogen-activated protein kinase kinase kinase 1, partial [Tanacetum coccineum]